MTALLLALLANAFVVPPPETKRHLEVELPAGVARVVADHSLGDLKVVVADGAKAFAELDCAASGRLDETVADAIANAGIDAVMRAVDGAQQSEVAAMKQRLLQFALESNELHPQLRRQLTELTSRRLELLRRIDALPSGPAPGDGDGRG